MNTLFATIIVAIMFAMSSTPAVEARDLRVVIENNSSLTMLQLFGSNRDRTDWENDIFGSSVLDPYGAVVVDFEDHSGYCIFDIKAVWEDGHEHIFWGANVCELTDITFTYE